MSNQDKPNSEKLSAAYHTMLGYLKDAWQDAEEITLPLLKEGLQKSQQKVSELEELTREEAEKIGDYIKRDIRDAASFLEENGKEFKDWIKFDLEFAESKFADLFGEVADKTRAFYQNLAEDAEQNGEWHTGEITGVGVLYCSKCGEALHFTKPGHIPPCPKCAATVFKKHYQAK